jgi:putative colanic acid biosysnthesis UDP-glucose lipid carrier transferase
MNNLAEFRNEARQAEWTPPESGTLASPPGVIPASPAAMSPVKRALDILVALVALLLFLPLLLLVGVLIRAETPGPALFRQKRSGLGGRPFTIYKFRTMTVVEDGDTVRQATKDDARVTPTGAMLRKFSIDELPQILNVLKGEMSLIGPRPHALAHDEAWAQAAPNYARRFRAKPGLTGWAQVCGHRGEVTDIQAVIDRVNADNDYIDNWSMSLDLKILWSTIPLIFSDANAY